MKSPGSFFDRRVETSLKLLASRLRIAVVSILLMLTALIAKAPSFYDVEMADLSFTF